MIRGHDKFIKNVNYSFRVDLYAEGSALIQERFTINPGLYRIVSRVPVSLIGNNVELRLITDQFFAVNYPDKVQLIAAAGTATREYCHVVGIECSSWEYLRDLHYNNDQPGVWSAHNGTVIAWPVAQTIVNISNALWREVNVIAGSPLSIFIDEIWAYRGSGNTITGMVNRNRIHEIGIVDVGANIFYTLRNERSLDSGTDFGFHWQAASHRDSIQIPGDCTFRAVGNADGVNADNLFIWVKGHYLQ